MAKITDRYETVFIVTVENGEEFTASVVEKFKTLIGENSVMGEVEEWGKRRLAYPINDLVEGYYVLIPFECKPDFPAELDRVYKITDGVMRSLIVCRDDVQPAAPKAEPKEQGGEQDAQ